MASANRKNIGKTFVIIGLMFLPFAYSNFALTAFPSDALPDYIKNHFIREIIFGITLTVGTIFLTLKPLSLKTFKQITLFGSIVVLPFWVSWLLGWTVGGMEAVWGNTIALNDAYFIHIPQVLFFFAGLALLWSEVRLQESLSTPP